MPSFADLGHRLRPSAQERAFADTLVLPVLIPAIGRDVPAMRLTPDGWVVVLQPLRPPRVRRLRPLLASALGLMLCALPVAELHGDESVGLVVAGAAQPVAEWALAPADARPAVESGSPP